MDRRGKWGSGEVEREMCAKGASSSFESSRESSILLRPVCGYLPLIISFANTFLATVWTHLNEKHVPTYVRLRSSLIFLSLAKGARFCSYGESRLSSHINADFTNEFFPFLSRISLFREDRNCAFSARTKSNGKRFNRTSEVAVLSNANLTNRLSPFAEHLLSIYRITRESATRLPAD